MTSNHAVSSALRMSTKPAEGMVDCALAHRLRVGTFLASHQDEEGYGGVPFVGSWKTRWAQEQKPTRPPNMSKHPGGVPGWDDNPIIGAHLQRFSSTSINFSKCFLRLLLCLCLTIHIATALHLFSACTLDVASTVMTRMHVRSSMRAHSPLSGSSVNESCAQDTEQKHGEHGSGAPLSSFPVLLVVVLAEHGGCLSSVDRDRELRIWNEREARRHECETRGW